MDYKIKFSEEALDDAASAFEYYKEISFDLAISFRIALQDSIRRIEKTPNNYLNLEDGKHRRYKIKRFPYVLIYEVIGDTVIVKMVFHQKDNPTRQSKRLK